MSRRQLKRTWHGGPPPHAGWWNASYERVLNAWRWWDGRRWSRVAYPSAPAENAREIARWPAGRQVSIEWTTYYPRNARVPRVNPSK